LDEIQCQRRSHFDTNFFFYKEHQLLQNTTFINIETEIKVQNFKF